MIETLLVLFWVSTLQLKTTLDKTTAVAELGESQSRMLRSLLSQRDNLKL